MPVYLAILRGINVSGHKMVKMDKLLASFKDLKFSDVSTYIQSGNVVFQCKATDPKELEEKIARKIEQDFAFEVPVIVKEKSELIYISKNNPFIKRKAEVTFLHVTFLSDVPEKASIEKIVQGKYGKDEFIISGKAIYLFCPGGYGNTKLSNRFFENTLKVVATTRNWKTVNELERMAESV